MNPNMWIEEILKKILVPVLDRSGAKWKTLTGVLLAAGLWIAKEFAGLPQEYYFWGQNLAMSLTGVGLFGKVLDIGRKE